jgi:hypothetical protein
MQQRHGYPRPQLRRPRWTCLNGRWDFCLDPDASIASPSEIRWTDQIVVPFAPETAASGIGNQGLYQQCWYRRMFHLPPVGSQRVLLHFGAVDYAATVWLNGVRVAHHEGGYTPFTIDITQLLVDGAQTLVVRAHDDPRDLAKPRGKQDWLLEPHAIWYPRTSGIWQTVWLEVVGERSIRHVQWTSSLERWDIGLAALIDGPAADDLRLRVRLHVGDLVLADDTYQVISNEVHRRVELSDPGVDDSRNELLWSPESPTLIQAELQLIDRHGEILDAAQSYTALRDVRVEDERVLLNGRPYRLRMVLDQGYWAESGLTAPSEDALRTDVQLVKRMGFNGVRKHQKIEDPRYLYWADALGLLVWEEMPSAYRFTPTAVQRLTQEWTAAIERDRSHPCIAAWVPINESWGVPDLTAIPQQRAFVQALYHLTHTLDPTRPVVGNDGWEFVATDIVGIHDYDTDLLRIAQRYITEESLPRLFRRERPGGHSLAVEGYPHTGQPIVLSEFGGIALSSQEFDSRGWGYDWTSSASEFADRYQRLMRVVRSLSLLAGYAYTQFTDTYQEVNGLLKMDRTPKLPFEVINQANRSTQGTREEQLQHLWEERMQAFRHEQNIVPADNGWVESPDYSQITD